MHSPGPGLLLIIFAGSDVHNKLSELSRVTRALGVFHSHCRVWPGGILSASKTLSEICALASTLTDSPTLAVSLTAFSASSFTEEETYQICAGVHPPSMY